MILKCSLTNSGKEKPRGYTHKYAGAVPARGGPRAETYCGQGEQTREGPLGTGCLSCFLQCLLLKVGHQMHQYSHSYGPFKNPDCTSTEVSDMTWVLSVELGVYFEGPGAWEKMLVFKYTFKFKMGQCK